MTPRRLGRIAIARILEREEPTFLPTTLLPPAMPQALAPHRSWLEPRGLDPATGKIIMPVQTWVVRTSHHNILVDACLGEGKTCRWHLPWQGLRGLRFLDDLRALGLAPADVDFVVCTHLHGDHVGWNTRLDGGGRWVPTFPNARYVIARSELAYWEDWNRTASPEDYEECIDESVRPVVAAGQALLVEPDHALDDEARLVPLPGHTPGHVGVALESGGARAIMIGDLMHSPVQCAEPDWHAGSDVDAALARQVRRRFLDEAADSGRLILTAHFPSPSAGTIRREGDVFRFHYIDE